MLVLTSHELAEPCDCINKGFPKYVAREIPAIVELVANVSYPPMSDAFLEALEQFESGYEQARTLEGAAASFMALSTADTRGHPSVRTVDFTGLVGDCFTFFVNKDSGKGKQLDSNPWVGLCFYWPRLQQQVVVDGKAHELADNTADNLWRSRSRSSALMAWASEQSIESPELTKRYQEAQSVFSDERTGRPPNWVAYAVLPHRIEFWHGGWRGRRERIAYVNGGSNWKRTTVNP